MLCYILVIGLVLQPFTLAKGITKENKIKIDCDKPEVTKAGDKFFDCFNKNVTQSITNNHLSCDLRPPLLEYIQEANLLCYNGTLEVAGPGVMRNPMKFIKLVEFSMRKGEFQDFVKNNGVQCIAAVKNKISECSKNEVGSMEDPNASNKHRKYDNLVKMIKLTIDERSCKATNRIKHCTQKAMRDESLCKQPINNVLYVGSMFEYMSALCSSEEPNWMESHKPHSKNPHIVPNIVKGTRTTHALLVVLLVLGILTILYVCVRDCRAPGGQWKAINERISMSIMNRRRSLVNNEACQGN